jgi:formiminotetrahydrofolate cyclodeaminase
MHRLSCPIRACKRKEQIVPETIYDCTQPLAAFLDAAAAKQPTPGGGSIAALTGALAAAMGEMVLNYSVNKKDLQAHRPALDTALAEFHRARQLLSQLMVEDQAAYAALTAARKAPEQGTGSPEFEAALLASIRIPQAIGATAVAMLEISDRIVEKVNRYLLSDLAVCADLAMATARCASYNIRANLPDVSDTAERANFEAAAAKQVARGVELIRRITPRIQSQTGGVP